VPFRIQRVPQGLNNLLSIFGGGTPIELEDRIRGQLDLLQFYGLQQQRVTFDTGAIAETATVNCIAAAAERAELGAKWAVLFGASMGGVKTATMTAFRVSIEMIRRGNTSSITLASGELGPFGATETGAAGVEYFSPQPILLAPPWSVFGRLQILGTDATATCTCVAEIGILQ